MKKGQKKRTPFQWCESTEKAAKDWFLGVAQRLNIPTNLQEIEATVFAPTGVAVCNMQGKHFCTEVAVFDSNLGSWQLCLTLR